MAPRSDRAPLYRLADEPAYAAPKRLGRDPFEDQRDYSFEPPEPLLRRGFDDTSHLAIEPPVDRHGAFRREDHARAVLVTVAVIAMCVAGLGVLWRLLH